LDVDVIGNFGVGKQLWIGEAFNNQKNQAAAIAGFSPIFANFAALLTEHDNSKYIRSLQG